MSRIPIICELFLIGGAGIVAADGAEFPQPKTFTFQTDGAPLGKVLDELTKQTGVTIDRSQLESDRQLRLNCDKVPFWEAFQKIARESDHRISVAEDGRKLQLQGGGDITYKEMPFSIDRLFRVSVRKVEAVSDLENDRSYTDVTLALHWESGIAVFLVDSPGPSVTAKDNNEIDLTVAEDGGGRVPASGNGVELQVRLTGVQRSAKNIRVLSGKMGIIGAAKMVEFAFPKPVASKENREEKNDDVTVRLRTDFSEKNDLWSARVEFEYPSGGPQLESFESSAWLADNQAWLQSADGKTKLECNGGYEVVAQSDRKAVVIYHFTDDTDVKLGQPENWTFCVKTPSKLLTTDVKFRLENIPLP
jgi:hypothetical protein